MENHTSRTKHFRLLLYCRFLQSQILAKSLNNVTFFFELLLHKWIQLWWFLKIYRRNHSLDIITKTIHVIPFGKDDIKIKITFARKDFWDILWMGFQFSYTDFWVFFSPLFSGNIAVPAASTWCYVLCFLIIYNCRYCTFCVGFFKLWAFKQITGIFNICKIYKRKKVLQNQHLHTIKIS